MAVYRALNFVRECPWCQDSVFCQYHKCYLDLIDFYIIDLFPARVQEVINSIGGETAYNWVGFVQFKPKQR